MRLQPRRWFGRRRVGPKTCETGRNWAVDLNSDAHNRDWPGSDAPDSSSGQAPSSTTAGCSPLVRAQINYAGGTGTPLGSGTGNLLCVLASGTAAQCGQEPGGAPIPAGIPGGIGYADLPDLNGPGVSATYSALLRPQLANAATGAFVDPLAGANANCDFSVLGLPGSGDPAISVGLDPSDSWAYDQTPINHVDATFKGSLYPACGVTFALVYTTLSDTSGGANAITRMTPNERMQLYSYFTYVLSPLGQSRLAGIRYKALPTSWLDSLRAGFQQNF